VRTAPKVASKRSRPESTKGAKPLEFTPAITWPEATATICSALPL
jgi:hypothetical protein